MASYAATDRAARAGFWVFYTRFTSALQRIDILYLVGP